MTRYLSEEYPYGQPSISPEEAIEILRKAIANKTIFEDTKKFIEESKPILFEDWYALLSEWADEYDYTFPTKLKENIAHHLASLKISARQSPETPKEVVEFEKKAIDKFFGVD